MHVWRALLFVYKTVDVRCRTRGLRSRRYRHNATETEVADAVESFRAFPELVANLTSGAAGVIYDIVHVERALTSLSRIGPGKFWPSPDDTRVELNEFAPAGSRDSIFIFWPQNDFRNGVSIPSAGWGLGSGASAWSNNATYATVANAPSRAWQGEAPGEVWLHEWLHGVCHHFAQQGHVMPERDADGAEIHGYVRSPTAGWTDYYRDLMTGNVLEDGRTVGIGKEAWQLHAGRIA